MADLPISGLPSTTSLTAGDLFPVVQSGTTKQVTRVNVAKGIIEPTAKVANYNVTSSDETILGNATGGDISLFLPAVSGTQGKKYSFKKIDSSSNSVIIDPDGAETIDGAATYSLATQYRTVEIESDGTQWLIKAINDTSNASGDVVGPGSSTDNAIARYDGTTGNLIQNSGVTIDDSGNMGIGTTSPGAKLEIETGAVATKGLIVQGAASQTANLQEWQDFNGTVFASVSSNGTIYTTKIIADVSDTYGQIALTSGANGGEIQFNDEATMIKAFRNGAVSRNLSLFEGSTSMFAVGRKSSSPFTAVNLNYGLSFVNSPANWSINRLTLMAPSQGLLKLIDGNYDSTLLASLESNAITILNSTASTIPLTIKGSVAQSANLTEWQNSAGTVLVFVDSVGKIRSNANMMAGTGSGQATLEMGFAGYGFSYNSNGEPIATINGTARVSLGINVRIGSNGAFAWGDVAHAGINATSDTALSRNAAGIVEINSGTAGQYRDLILRNIVAASSATIPVTVKGAASQTANLTEWQNSAGTVLSAFDFAGKLGVGTASPETTLHVKSSNASGMIFERTNSLNSNIEFRNSTDSMFVGISGVEDFVIGTSNNLDASGILTVTRAGNVGIGENSPGANLQVNAETAATKGLIVKAAASQIANLTEWQNSAGTVLASITKDGYVHLPSGSASVPSLKIGAGTDGIAVSSASTFMNFILSGTTRLQFGTANMRFAGTGTASAPAYSWIDYATAGMYINALGVNNPPALSHVGNLVAEFNFYRGASLYSRSAAYPALSLIAHASQSGNIQEWQNSAGAALALVNSGGDIEITDSTKGVILKSPDSTRWRVTIDNTGALITTSL
jgi:hypothetical protein